MEPNVKTDEELLQKNAILRYFNFAHLPEHLQRASKPFHAIAYMVARDLPNGPERTVALRKLLEAKDAAVRTLV